MKANVSRSRVVWLAMYALLTFILDRPATQKPSRTTKFISIPQTPTATMTALYGTSVIIAELRPPNTEAPAVVESSLLLDSVRNFADTWPIQSTVDCIAVLLAISPSVSCIAVHTSSMQYKTLTHVHRRNGKQVYVIDINKKLCYRRGTARRAMSVKFLSTVEMQVVRQIHNKSQ